MLEFVVAAWGLNKGEKVAVLSQVAKRQRSWFVFVSLEERRPNVASRSSGALTTMAPPLNKQSVKTTTDLSKAT